MNNKKLKILVTGGAGNIGTNLCNELRSRNYYVLSSDLYNTERDDYVRCDVRNYRQLEDLFNSNNHFDFVYHLAAEYVDGMVKLFMKIYGRQIILGQNTYSSYKKNLNSS